MTKGRNRKRMLVVSNMWPDATHPSSGIFVKKFVDQAESLGWDCDLAVMKSSDGKAGKLFRYIAFYASSFLKTLLGFHDVIYIHYPSFSAPTALVALRFRRRRVIVNVHGSDVLPITPRQERMHRYTREAVVSADKVVVPSEYFARVVAGKYGIDPGNIHVYPSGGIDPRTFHPLSDLEVRAIKERLCLDSTIPTLCFAGRITEGKGWDTYLQAVAKVLSDGHCLNIILVGSGDQDAQCELLAKELGLESIIVRMGLQPQERLCELYNAADVFVFPGRRSESLGLVAVEAMACGTPVIASDFAAPRYYVRDGINGIKVPSGDAEALAGAIEKFIGEPGRVRIMRAGALRTAKEYSTDSIRQRLSAVLE